MENDVINFTQFVTWGFLGLLTAAVSVSAKFLYDMSKSVADINTKIAVILTRQDQLEKDRDSHDLRIRHLESQLAAGYDS